MLRTVAIVSGISAIVTAAADLIARHHCFLLTDQNKDSGEVIAGSAVQPGSCRLYQDQRGPQVRAHRWDW